jgi:hypothetical protein
MRSARIESIVINTRFGLEAAAAKEKQRNIRLTPAKTFLIMAVSVKAMSPMIKRSKGQKVNSPQLTSRQLLVQSMYLLLGISSSGDAVIAIHR